MGKNILIVICYSTIRSMSNHVIKYLFLFPYWSGSQDGPTLILLDKASQGKIIIKSGGGKGPPESDGEATRWKTGQEMIFRRANTEWVSHFHGVQFENKPQFFKWGSLICWIFKYLVENPHLNVLKTYRTFF